MSIGCIQSSSVGLLGHQSVTVWLLFRDLASAGLIPNNIQYTYICSFDWYCSFPYPIRWWSSNNGRTNRQMDGYDWRTDSRISYSDTHTICAWSDQLLSYFWNTLISIHTPQQQQQQKQQKSSVWCFSFPIVLYFSTFQQGRPIPSTPLPFPMMMTMTMIGINGF